MTTVDQLRANDRLTFARECEVTQIPSGNKLKIPKDAEGVVTQTLGGNVTLAVAWGLVQVTSKNLDALLKDGEPVAPAKQATPATEKEAAGPADEKEVWEAMKQCYDPEIPCNIVDLGLVYDVKLTGLPSNGSRVDVKMTLTAVGCGMGPQIAAQVRERLLQVSGVEEANVELVWDPPWNQGMITEAGRKRLGIW